MSVIILVVDRVTQLVLQHVREVRSLRLVQNAQIVVVVDVALLVQKVVKVHQNHLLAQVVVVDALEVVLAAVNHLVVVVVLVHQKVAIVKDAKVIVIRLVGLHVQNIVPMTAKVIARQHVHHHVIEDFVQVDVAEVVQPPVVELVNRLAPHHVLGVVILPAMELVEEVVILLVLVLVPIG